MWGEAAGWVWTEQQVTRGSSITVLSGCAAMQVKTCEGLSHTTPHATPTWQWFTVGVFLDIQMWTARRGNISRIPPPTSPIFLLVLSVWEFQKKNLSKEARHICIISCSITIRWKHLKVLFAIVIIVVHNILQGKKSLLLHNQRVYRNKAGGNRHTIGQAQVNCGSGAICWRFSFLIWP